MNTPKEPGLYQWRLRPGDLWTFAEVYGDSTGNGLSVLAIGTDESFRVDEGEWGRKASADPDDGSLGELTDRDIGAGFLSVWEAVIKSGDVVIPMSEAASIFRQAVVKNREAAK